MSSDDELPPPSQRGPRSKKTAPATPDESESDPDYVEEVEKTVNRSYARPRIMWVRKLTINKGEMDYDEAKENRIPYPRSQDHLNNSTGNHDVLSGGVIFLNSGGYPLLSSHAQSIG